MSKIPQPPNSVATSLGWVNPKTGEVLVSNKNLDWEINLHGIARRDFVNVIKSHFEKKEKEVKKESPVVEEKEVKTPKESKKAVSKKASTTKKTTSKK